MSLVPVISFLAFTGLVAIISYLKARDEDLSHSTGYFLAGRSLSWIVIAGSLFLTNISAEQLTGLNGNAFAAGASVMAWETVAVVACVVMAVYFLPRYLKSGLTTVPQFLEERFGIGMRRVASFVYLYALVIGFLPFVLYAGALTLGKLFNISGLLGISENAALWLMVVAVGVVGGCYAVFGGLKAVAVSDTINGIGLVIGGTMIPVLGLIKLGEGNLFAGWRELTQIAPERMQALGTGPEAGIPWTTLFTGMLIINLFYWCTNQAIVQRAFAAKNLAEGQKGVLGAAVLKLFGVGILVVPGIIAWHLHQKGMITIPFKEITGSESGILNQDMAYPILVRYVLPQWLTGFFGAVMFGAVLSSFNSGVNSMSTLYSVDIYKGMIRKNATDQQMVRSGKLFGSILIVVCIGIAPFISRADGLYTLMRIVMAVINVPIFTVILFGFFSKRAPALSGYVGLPCGIAFFGIMHFGLNDNFGLFQLHWLHTAGLNFVLMMAVMTAIRYWKPQEKSYHQKYSGDVDITSWRHLKLASLIILGSLVAMYGIFSKIGILNTEGNQFRNSVLIVVIVALVFGLIGVLMKDRKRN